MVFSTLGVTRWNVLTPVRFPLRVKAAQSMGEWPGERRALPRALGVGTAPFGLRPLLTRCWLFAGGPLFGKGPVVGTRREVVAFGRALGVGRGGGGIRPV